VTAVLDRRQFVYQFSPRLFLSYLFLTIPVRPIISKSAGPIFSIFGKFSRLVKLWLEMISLKLVFRYVAVSGIFFGFIHRNDFRHASG